MAAYSETFNHKTMTCSEQWNNSLLLISLSRALSEAQFNEQANYQDHPAKLDLVTLEHGASTRSNLFPRKTACST